ncbi:phosphoribosylformylglycinamidine synthase [bacterium]|nr:phosphoribosylformylglycinamidine synthase [bacterium]
MSSTLFDHQEFSFLIQSADPLSTKDIEKLKWILEADLVPTGKISGRFIGPRKEMLSPWSTNVTDVLRNMGIQGISRIESFQKIKAQTAVDFDAMLQAEYHELSEVTLQNSTKPALTFGVKDIEAFNLEHGLALSREELDFLKSAATSLERELTDVEIFAFGQINSEHCRHKIFNGSFVINNQVQEKSLFAWIKETTKQSGAHVVSAYSDNVAFIQGAATTQFVPNAVDRPGTYQLQPTEVVLSLKAETHNFPTTVEPFYGASTGSGGEIRDRMAGGQAGIPLAGISVYMTAYPRLKGSRAKNWEQAFAERPWKYQTPSQILIKASLGASDFGNKFGQPMLCGSLLTFEGQSNLAFYGYDRTVMLAGGTGYANLNQAHKLKPQIGDKVVVLGGDNYRIGLAGGSVSSVDAGNYAKDLELTAIQRANPEMQKRVFNAIRALAELPENPIKLIHDHGAGGHINCFSELLEATGGKIKIRALPIGDETLSVREILCNESQERMGLIVAAKDLPLVQAVCLRENAPCYVVGELTGDGKIVFEEADSSTPFNLPTAVLFGSSPKLKLEDQELSYQVQALQAEINTAESFTTTVLDLLSLESVACKDWLTNKVDRCVGGRVARQQCVGALQLPLSNVSISTLDFTGESGVATAIGHAPIAGLIDAQAGAILSVAEALTNLIWAPLEGGLARVALSANWMWPAKRPGENARLYRAVKALSEFCIELGIPVPTGKDSLSMTTLYGAEELNQQQKTLEVRSPGTVIVTAVAPTKRVTACVTPDLKAGSQTVLIYLNLSGLSTNPLGGSAYAQTRSLIGDICPTVADAKKFKSGLELIQQLIVDEKILSGHDVSSGGVIATLLEMAFAGELGFSTEVKLSPDFYLCEKPAVIIQVRETDSKDIIAQFTTTKIEAFTLARVSSDKAITLSTTSFTWQPQLSELRKAWFKPSALFDQMQTAPGKAAERLENFDKLPLNFSFPKSFTGKKSAHQIDPLRASSSGVVAAVIREQGTNGDREMAMGLFAAGFDVRDVTMSDLISGRETLEDISMIAFPGGFANSDVLGAGKGWAGACLFNARAREALERFYARDNTLSIGVCNGCQLVAALDLVRDRYFPGLTMQQNASRKFESAFLGVEIRDTASIMLKPLIGTKLGIWVAHGEGRFVLPGNESDYDIPVRYLSSSYPLNPNGADYNAAGVCSKDGRHLVIMPHLERSLFPWNWGYYPQERFKSDELSPWLLSFRAAFEWIRARF